MNRLRLKYVKGDDLRWLSHLEVARSWQRIIKRARLPVKYSEGFSPHPRLSMGPALAVGISSEAEYIDVLMETSVEPDQAIKRLSQVAPKELRALKAKEIPIEIPSLGSSIVYSDMNVEIKGSLVESVVKEAWRSCQDLEIRPKSPVAGQNASFLLLLEISEKIPFTRLTIRLPLSLKISGVIERLEESIGQKYNVTRVDRIAQWVLYDNSLLDPLEV